MRAMADRMCAMKIEELLASERSLEKKVLAYLRKHGPKKWIEVYWAAAGLVDTNLH